MARIRTIKPSFFRSEGVSQLPFRARLTWIGLWTFVDDSGRMKDNVKLIKGDVWPLDEVSLDDIEDDLNALADRGKVLRYEVEGRRYLQIVNWDKHQRINRRAESSIPAPEQGTLIPIRHRSLRTHEPLTEDSVSPHGTFTEDSLRTHARNKETEGNKEGKKDSRAHAQLTEDSVSPHGKSPKRRSDPDFETFYEVYPRKKDRGHAETAWNRAVAKAGVDGAVVVAAAKRYAEEMRGKDAQYIAYPATWLNGKRWLDQAEPSQPQGHQGFKNPDPREYYEEF